MQEPARKGTEARPIRILLIEDNPTDIFLLRTVFTDTGVPCVWRVLQSGRKGLDLSQTELDDYDFHPDVILIDWKLPEASGLEVLASFKRSQSWRGIPAMILTGWLSPLLSIQAAELGAAFCLSKASSIDEWANIPQRIQAHLTESLEAVQIVGKNIKLSHVTEEIKRIPGGGYIQKLSLMLGW